MLPRHFDYTTERRQAPFPTGLKPGVPWRNFYGAPQPWQVVFFPSLCHPQYSHCLVRVRYKPGGPNGFVLCEPRGLGMYETGHGKGLVSWDPHGSKYILVLDLEPKTLRITFRNELFSLTSTSP